MSSLVPKTTIQISERGELNHYYADLEQNFFKPLNTQFNSHDVDSVKEVVLRLLTDQENANPKQWVGHGCYHAWKSWNYTREIINVIPAIPKALARQYKITIEQANFLLELGSLLHDIGYHSHQNFLKEERQVQNLEKVEDVKNVKKALHGVLGGEKLDGELKLKLWSMFELNNETFEQLYSQLRESIFFHSADIAERKFEWKATSKKGEILLDKEPDCAQIQSLNRFLTHKPNIIRGEFRGRTVLNKAGISLGIETQQVDLLNKPFHVIRLADNMDITQERLTPLQKTAGFIKKLDLLSIGHYGGCLGIKEVTIALEDSNPILQIGYNNEHSEFQQLKDCVVTYEYFSLDRKKIRIKTPVTAFQIHRTVDALKSVTIGGKNIKIRIKK